MEQRLREVESVVIDRAFWKGRKVFLTGHTGFKGGWASLLLHSLGAKVVGFSLPPDGNDAMFKVAGIGDIVEHQVGDIRDAGRLRAALERTQPTIVIHMAAQALVRQSYRDPVETYATNVMGTVHLLDAVRHVPGIEAVVIVTSDKCYENVGSIWGYRETDRMGGHDPYSNSKGCAELVTDSYRRSFFHSTDTPHVASARAGNVIGGGDWSSDRLIPDAMRAFLAGEALHIRNPTAVRPWQHVLDPVIGYLLLAERLVTEGASVAEGWNFGPAAGSAVPVAGIADSLGSLWGGSARWTHDRAEHPHEAAYLKLDCTKAELRLGWRPLINIEDALRLTVDWYRAFGKNVDMRTFSLRQIEDFLGRTPSSEIAA